MSRMRLLSIITGGLITIGLALWLLPKPGTEVDSTPAMEPSEPAAPAYTEPVEPRVPVPVPAPSVAPTEPTATPPVAATVPSAPVLGPYPVSSRGFREAMRSRYDQIIACYDRWALEQPDLPDRQLVRFYIEPDDTISQVDRVEVMDSPIDNGPMEACVLDVMMDVEFEPSDTMTVYTFPFRFGEAPDK